MLDLYSVFECIEEGAQVRGVWVRGCVLLGVGVGGVVEGGLCLEGAECVLLRSLLLGLAGETFQDHFGVVFVLHHGN
jgi:hypothetical protein